MLCKLLFGLFFVLCNPPTSLSLYISMDLSAGLVSSVGLMGPQINIVLDLGQAFSVLLLSMKADQNLDNRDGLASVIVLTDQLQQRVGSGVDLTQAALMHGNDEVAGRDQRCAVEIGKSPPTRLSSNGSGYLILRNNGDETCTEVQTTCNFTPSPFDVNGIEFWDDEDDA